MITQDNEDDDDDLEGEDPDPSDMDQDDADVADEVETASCPFCGKKIFGDADVCPHCRNFISWPSETRPRRWIWAIAAILVVAGMLAWIWQGLKLW